MTKGAAVFITRVVDGLLEKYRTDIGDAIAKLDGQRIKITIEKAKKSRSLNQNAFYFGVVLQYVQAILHAAGNTEMTILDCHEFCKQAHVGNLEQTKMIVIKDEVYFHKAYRSTTSLSTMEMEAYIERIRVWAAQPEIGVIIPLPNEEINQSYIEPTGE